MLERVVHAICVIACHVAEDDYKPFLAKYKSKNNGREKFATHLGLALMEEAITRAWHPRADGQPCEEDKPAWMPQTKVNGKYHPCNCNECFSCKNKSTNGATHGTLTARPKTKPACSGEREELPGAKARCVVCLRLAQDKHPGLGARELDKKKGLIKRPTKGCTQCEEGVCKDCWEHRCKHKAERRGDETWWRG